MVVIEGVNHKMNQALLRVGYDNSWGLRGNRLYSLSNGKGMSLGDSRDGRYPHSFSRSTSGHWVCSWSLSWSSSLTWSNSQGSNINSNSSISRGKSTLT